jgi:hypothetical protein
LIIRNKTTAIHEYGGQVCGKATVSILAERISHGKLKIAYLTGIILQAIEM